VTDDLVTFLKAHLDADERAAQRVRHAYDDEGFWAPPAVVNAFALVDPARVLAEVQAKRRIIELHEGEQMTTRDGDGEEWEDLLCGRCLQHFPCTTLELLALPYADAPGYRAEWAPDTEVNRG
jgi:hypothetical protein